MVSEDFLILFWIFSAGPIVGALIGLPTGRPGIGALLGTFLGPLGWCIMGMANLSMSKCPACLSLVPAKASRCRYCGEEAGEQEPVRREIIETDRHGFRKDQSPKWVEKKKSAKPYPYLK